MSYTPTQLVDGPRSIFRKRSQAVPPSVEPTYRGRFPEGPDDIYRQILLLRRNPPRSEYRNAWHRWMDELENAYARIIAAQVEESQRRSREQSELEAYVDLVNHYRYNPDIHHYRVRGRPTMERMMRRARQRFRTSTWYFTPEEIREREERSRQAAEEDYPGGVRLRWRNY